MTTPCLVDNLEHNYQFVTAESGQLYWICKNCGDVAIEYEDSTP